MIKKISKDYLISDSKSRLSVKTIHSFLSTSYWCAGIPLSLVKKQIKNSLCVGVYFKEKQIGFARIVTDFSSLAYLCDVFILNEHRGKGLSKELMNFLLQYPKLKNIRAWRLHTLDAHGLYSKHGFVVSPNPERQMEIKNKLW